MQIQEDCSITDFGWSLKSLRTFKEYNLALDSKFEEEDYEIDKYDYNEDDEYDYYNEEMDFIDDENIINWCKYLLLIPFVYHLLHKCQTALGQIFRIVFGFTPQGCWSNKLGDRR